MRERLRDGYFAAVPGFAYAGSAMHRLTIEELPQHPLLSGLQEAQLERIAQASELLRLEAGETLFNQGDEATRFYMVERGQLKLFRLAASGHEKVVELLTPGRTFAEAAMFMSPRRFPVSCEALTDCTVVALNSIVFLAMLEESPQTTMRLLATLSMRLHDRLADIEALAFQNATLRVVSFLAGLVPPDAVDSAAVELPFSKKNVALRLSLQPETLSRVFARLRDSGLVEIVGGVIRVPNVEALRRMAWDE
jgi:CRP-like cAMP-binding protein